MRRVQLGWRAFIVSYLRTAVARNSKRWKQQGLPQRYDLPSPFAVNDLHTPEPIRTFIDRDAPGTANEMVNSFHDDFQQIVFRVIGDAEQRQPFRSDLVAERKAGNLDVGAFADD
jgi:hypothetical protein